MKNSIIINQDITTKLQKDKYILLAHNDFTFSSEMQSAMQSLWRDWDNLRADKYLQGGASFRSRRFSYCYFLPRTGEILPLPHTAYFQASDINSYAGGIERDFAPLLDRSLDNIFLLELIRFNFKHFPTTQEQQENVWKIDIHQIRTIATTEEAGEPAPEGIHHDENEFGCIHLVKYENATGGVSTAYDNEKNPLESRILREPMDSMIIWDPHMMHGISPIYPKIADREAIRDTLLIGYSYMPDLQRP